MAKVEYKTINKVSGPLIFVEKTHPIGYGEIAEVMVGKEKKLGQVLETAENTVVVQLFEGTSGSSKSDSVKFLGEPLTIKLDESIKGSAVDRSFSAANLQKLIQENYEYQIRYRNKYMQEYQKNQIQPRKKKFRI